MPVASAELIDPFSLKHHPRWDPRRLLPTVKWRLIELEARVNFTRCCLLTRPGKLDQFPSFGSPTLGESGEASETDGERKSWAGGGCWETKG
jgi:hypothetical protein